MYNKQLRRPPSIKDIIVFEGIERSATGQQLEGF